LFKKLFTVAVCASVVLLALEQTLRVQTYGSVAFNPVKLNSMRLILNSDLVRPSEDLDIYYELKPDLDTWHKGVRFRTSHDGLHDRDYTRAKPPNSFRVAVLGSSWTMATSVAIEDTWHSIIEAELNENSGDVEFEFINFGIEMYGLAEISATAVTRATSYDPDLMVVTITAATGLFRWDEHTEALVLPPRAEPLFQSRLAERVALMMGRELHADRAYRRPMLDDMDRDSYVEQLHRALRKIHSVTAQRDIPIVVLALGWWPVDELILDALRPLEEELGIIIVDGHEPFDDGIKRRYGDDSHYRPYYVSGWDKHPNEEAHEIIARTLLTALAENRLLPVTD